MKVYVASSFLNIEETRKVMAYLTSLGHEITHDWTTKAVDKSWPLDRQAAYLQACGGEDYIGVKMADCLVLVNHEKCRDAMAEFGLAMGMRKKIIVLFPSRRESVFFHLADAQAENLQTLNLSARWLSDLLERNAEERRFMP